MSEERGPLGKLILLRRGREEAGRHALTRAIEAEERAQAAEADLAARHRAVERRLTRLREPPGEQPPAQVLQFQSRLQRTLWAMEVRVQVLLAEMRGERIGLQEATARARAELAVARRAREQAQERAAAIRGDRRRRREQLEELAQDDAPGRPGGAGPRGSG